MPKATEGKKVTAVRRGFVSLKCGVEYVENAKVACTAIKAALLEADGHGRPVDGGMAHCHRAWDQVPRDWQARHVFTFVRNPLDRLVSSYVEKLGRDLARRLGGNCPLPPTAEFRDWARWVTRQHPAKADRHWAPQIRNLRRHRRPGRLEPVTYRWELIETHWGYLVADYGLPTLARWNVSANRRPWQAYYRDRAIIRAVADYYREDLDRWGYQVDEDVILAEGRKHADGLVTGE